MVRSCVRGEFPRRRTAVLLVAALAFHVAEVGLIGLAVIVVLTAFTGATEEHMIGRSFVEALPFTALLTVFFAVVAMIEARHLFNPIIGWVLRFDGRTQVGALYVANGLLSCVSDNVFVASIYIGEIAKAFNAHLIDAAQYSRLAVATNMGTNIPSIATPNGQAAFLFLLTSSIAELIQLSYLRMVKLAAPYAIVLAGGGFVFAVLQ